MRQYLFPEMVLSDIPFTCGKPTFAIPGAEFALGAMLMFSRRNHVTVGMPKLTQRSPSQETTLAPVDLAGKTLGVLGMGGIGQALAPKAKAIGMRVVGTSRRSREAPEGVDRMYGMDEAVDMVTECDFVAVAVPETPETGGHRIGRPACRDEPGHDSYWTAPGVRPCTTMEHWSGRWRQGGLVGSVSSQRESHRECRGMTLTSGNGRTWW